MSHTEKGVWHEKRVSVSQNWLSLGPWEEQWSSKKALTVGRCWGCFRGRQSGVALSFLRHFHLDWFCFCSSLKITAPVIWRAFASWGSCIWKCRCLMQNELKISWRDNLIHSTYSLNINCQKCARIGLNGFDIKWIIGTHCNWKKSKSCEPFWSYQPNGTADLANLAKFWGEWARVAVL